LPALRTTLHIRSFAVSSTHRSCTSRLKPDAYEAWYSSPRGRWIGAVEYRLLESLLRLDAGASLLDVGCGTGHFTRRFAGNTRGTVIGVDPDEDALAYARTHATAGERYVAARAEALPFPDRSFDFAVSVTALCFVGRQDQALSELIRVTRKRFALGLLNRHSLLHLTKGRSGKSGGYRGAHWHTKAEVRTLLASLPVADVTLRSAVVLPQGGALARAVERCWPRAILFGGFLAVSGGLQVTPRRPARPLRYD
jgi:SAM-dependent methyltransferase